MAAPGNRHEFGPRDPSARHRRVKQARNRFTSCTIRGANNIRADRATPFNNRERKVWRTHAAVETDESPTKPASHNGARSPRAGVEKSTARRYDRLACDFKHARRHHGQWLRPTNGANRRRFAWVPHAPSDPPHSETSRRPARQFACELATARISLVPLMYTPCPARWTPAPNNPLQASIVPAMTGARRRSSPARFRRRHR